MTGQGKGEATVTYDDPNSAQAAIQWFGGKAIYTDAHRVYLIF